MLEAWVCLFEEAIAIETPSIHLLKLPERKKRKLFECSEHNREIGLRHSEISKKACFLYGLCLGETKLPKEVWLSIILKTFEATILERIFGERKSAHCFPLFREGVLECSCYEISIRYRDVEKDSYILRRKEYQFKSLELKLVYPPYFFSEDWLKYYKKYRRKKYVQFFKSLALFVFLLFGALSTSFHRELLSVIQLPLDLLIYLFHQNR